MHVVRRCYTCLIKVSRRKQRSSTSETVQVEDGKLHCHPQLGSFRAQLPMTNRNTAHQRPAYMRVRVNPELNGDSSAQRVPNGEGP